MTRGVCECMCMMCVFLCVNMWLCVSFVCEDSVVCVLVLVSVTCLCLPVCIVKNCPWCWKELLNWWKGWESKWATPKLSYLNNTTNTHCYTPTHNPWPPHKHIVHTQAHTCTHPQTCTEAHIHTQTLSLPLPNSIDPLNGPMTIHLATRLATLTLMLLGN